ncbi:uncharacterized protein BDV17DRAFT_288815 [Aspergillus undulatus]|uniref:uncharacterized protein n=1 Tax=Aspergillus undulatus TaxID=1810928 RepID=UPI003CCDED14
MPESPLKLPGSPSSEASWSPATVMGEIDPDYEEPEKQTFSKVSDENVVNTLLVLLAFTTTFSIPGFKVKTDKGQKVYEARTDGYLYTQNHPIKTSNVIIEAKPVPRLSCPKARMQETAQMAAWIHCERDAITGNSKKTFRRLMISQSWDAIYLIFAEYDADYVDYMTNAKRTVPCESFLTMNEYGPWSLSVPKDIETIMSIIIAGTLVFSGCKDLHPVA